MAATNFKGWRWLLVGLLAVGAVSLAGSAPQGKTEPKDFLIVQQGTLPIILSAPHGGTKAVPDVPERKGKGIKQFTATRDTNTQELAQQVAAGLEKQLGGKPFLVVALFHRKYIDANRGPVDAFEVDKAKPYYDAYHQALRAACERVKKEWGRGILLDIHGQSAVPDSLLRGTQNGKSVTALVDKFGKAALTGPKSILGYLEKKGYKVFPSHNSDEKEHPNYNGGYTVQAYGSAKGPGIDALQLEYGKDYREADKLPKTGADLVDAIAVFAREYLPTQKLKK